MPAPKLLVATGSVRRGPATARMRLRDREVFAGYIALLGVSERAFAEAAGLSHSTVNHLVSGRRSTCSAATAHAIERALRCPPGLMFAIDGTA